MPSGRAGGINAALFALNILSIEDADVAEKLAAYRKNMAEKIASKNKSLTEKGYKDYIAGLEG